MAMASPMTPVRHDLVLWRASRWLITRGLRFGRIEIASLDDPTVRWICLEDQLVWEPKSRAWMCNAYLVPLPGVRE
jgi:hypothetical protein